MKHIFIVNPVAGKKNASKELVPQIIKAAAALQVEYEIKLTDAPGHAAGLAEEYAKAGEPIRLYACGGDGTFHEVVQGAWPYPNAAVGCVPCGSGNDFVRNFSSCKDDFLNIEEMLRGEVLTVDLIRTPYGYATSTCSAGLDAQVAMGIDKWRRVPGCGGSVSYILSAVQQILGKLGMRLTVRIDGEEMSGDYLMAAICNGKAYGGGFLAAPPARLDDGLMDVLLVSKISRLKIAEVIGQYRKGSHISEGKVVERLRGIITYTKAKRVEITPEPGTGFAVNVDGECWHSNNLSAEILPNAARIILPLSAYENYQNTAAAAVK